MSLIATKLARLRRQKGFSQDEIAAKLNVSQPAYHKWETGVTRPTNDHIIKICEVFEIEVEDLLQDDTSAFNSNTISDSTVLNSSNSIISNVNMLSPKIVERIIKNQEHLSEILTVQNRLIETLIGKIKG